jgi:hypothetical protein
MGRAKDSSRSTRSLFNERVLGFIVLGLLLTACARPPWPVPIPEDHFIEFVEGREKKIAQRLQLALPLTDPAPCQELSREDFLREAEGCPNLNELKMFIDRHEARIASVGAPAYEIDNNLWELMRSFLSEDTLRAEPFPKKAEALPKDARQLKTWRTVDSRDETPPEGRPPVAFLYRGFWWTFWQKQPPPPRPPESGIDLRAKTPFDTLIIFPEFPGRIPTGR